MLYSCNDGNSIVKPTVSAYVSPLTPSHDVFERVSDSFRKYNQISIIKLIEGNMDSAMYYDGKSDAYYSVEGIILYRLPSKK
ncbi:MAG: hypothetical protein V4560_14960 [Bacteroidota bacterium]